MTTLELARKLDLCLAAQVKLQKERDAAIEELRLALSGLDAGVELCQKYGDETFLAFVLAADRARAAIAKATEDK